MEHLKLVMSKESRPGEMSDLAGGISDVIPGADDDDSGHIYKRVDAVS